MENEKKLIQERIAIVKWIFVGVAIAVFINLILAFIYPKYNINLCRNEDCDNYCEESDKITVKVYGEDEGVIYVYVFVRNQDEE